ncbi:MAG: tetratricopeptide repeat protein [Ignavibacteriae bacterium]|nr:tetratricopeptide repeat protein [Ignavibacteriota bacterium]
MAIKPKYNFSGTAAFTSLKTEKKFTDREPFLAAFHNALATKVKDEHKILVYYGVGGIGKTCLRKELCKRLETEKPDIVWTAIDFDNPSYREEESALFVLRNRLNEKFKINFPLFDIAYTIHWQKTHPQTPMTTDNFPLLSGVNIVTEIIRVVGEIPQIGFVPKLTKAFISDANVFHKWWEKKGKKELANLPSLEPKDISNRMPMFLANDLKDFIVEKKKDAVLFLDTYEALWENLKTDIGFFERDEWIRELISHLPEVIWIICGREKLRWNEKDEEWNNHIEQHLLGRLSDEDSAYFLKSCGIEKTDVRNVIITASKGVPYFLDLAVDTYFEIQIRHQREPEAKDFAKTQQDVLERFLKYLDYTEIETLKILSVVRVWDSEIFRFIVKKFRTGYPITQMENLFRFSFINETEKPGMHTMHDLMSESLQSKLEPDKLKTLHKALFQYYDEKLSKVDLKNIDENAKHYLIEASEHGKAFLEPGEYFEWFCLASKKFFYTSQYRLLLPMGEDALKMMEVFKGKDSLEYANALQILAKIFRQLGKYKDSETMYRQVLEKKEKLLGHEHFEVGRVINSLARLLSFQGRFTEAEPILKRAIEIIEKNSGGDSKEVSEPLSDLAILYAILGRYDDAALLFKRLLYLI